MSAVTSAAATRPQRIIALLPHQGLLNPPSRLAQVVRNAATEHASHAEVEVIEPELGQLLELARGHEASGNADAFICAGSAGQYLRQHLNTPVAPMRVNGFDLLAALHEAAQLADTVAIFSRERAQPEIAAAASLFNLRVVHRIYNGTRDVRIMLDQNRAQGISVVIGSNLIVQYAQSIGLAGILSIAHHSARQALDEALVFCRRAQAETAKKQQLNTMLAHMDEGIIALDQAGVIQAINPAMASLLEMPADTALERALRDVAPALAAVADSAHDGGDYRMVNFGHRSIMVNHIPVVTHGVPTGAILKCQDTEMVARADRRIRSSRRRSRFVARYHLYQILGESPAIRTAARLAAQYARTDSTVLITGESGTGKELLAQGIHNASPRNEAPFVAINCAALPETLLESELFGYEEGAFSGSRRGGKPGLFELAHTGTLFLDEIGDMPLSLQTRLLRVLQEQEVLRLGGVEPTPINVRIIAATHRDLAERIAQDDFREDLYYRINILRLHAPPLRERPEDIPELARHLAQDIAGRSVQRTDLRALLDTLMPALVAYSWPGNVRELANVIERAVVSLPAIPAQGMAPQLLRRSLPELYAGRPDAAAPPSRNLRAHLREVAYGQARQALDECGGNHDEAARRLGISRSTLWRRLRN